MRAGKTAEAVRKRTAIIKDVGLFKAVAVASRVWASKGCPKRHAKLTTTKASSR